MTELTVDTLLDILEGFPGNGPVRIRLEGTPSMPVESAVIDYVRGRPELSLVLPARPLDSAVDADLSRLCENMIKGVSTIFQVRFGMDLMRQAGAETPAARLHALSMYFKEAQRMIDDTIRFGQEAGEMAEDDMLGDDMEGA